jgi:hypothetical protein
VEEIENEPLHAKRVAALDIGKAMLQACIRVPGANNPQRGAQEVRTFGTTTKEIISLADWLRCQGVAQVVMESTPLLKGPLLPVGSPGVHPRPVGCQAGQGAGGPPQDRPL